MINPEANHPISTLQLQISPSLLLKEITPEDAEAIFNAINRQREYLGKWLPFVQHTKHIDDTLLFIQAAQKNAEEKSEFVFSIYWENQFAGLIGMKDSDNQNKKTEIGYWLVEELQHKGIITLATCCLCTYIFRHLDKNRIQIRCGSANLSSRKIPERIGFNFEGYERDGELLSDGLFTDLAVYSMLKKDWKMRGPCLESVDQIIRNK